MNKVAELKNALGPVARPNKYRLNFSIPSIVPTISDLSKVDVLCKASSFPSVSIGQIEVYNQGRKLVIPGDTAYENTWTLTFYQTEDHALRKDMISWMKTADNFIENTHAADPGALMGELSVEQLNSVGTATAKYTFFNVFVQAVGEITVGDDQQDTAMEFDVTFSFTNWDVE
jgi:hypothetical protein